MYSLLGQCMYAKILNSKSVIEILGVILLFKLCIVLFENLSENLYKLKHNFKLFFCHFVIGVVGRPFTATWARVTLYLPLELGALHEPCPSSYEGD